MANQHKDRWTPAIIAFLRGTMAQGVSTGIVAKKIEERFGVVFTRNSIIGKCNRLGIELSKKPTQKLSPREDSKKFKWDAERLERMREYAKQGMSASIIADRLTEDFGIHVSRNSVIGKAYREGGSLRADIARPVYRREGTRVQLILDAPEAPGQKKIWGRTTFPNPEARGLAFMDVGFNDCRYPVGEAREGTLLFCGARTMSPGLPYCEICHKIVYVPTTLKKGGPREHRKAAVHGHTN